MYGSAKEIEEKLLQDRQKLIADLRRRNVSQADLIECCADLYLGLNGLVDMCEILQKKELSLQAGVRADLVLDIVYTVQDTVKKVVFRTSEGVVECIGCGEVYTSHPTKMCENCLKKNSFCKEGG